MGNMYMKKENSSFEDDNTTTPSHSIKTEGNDTIENIECMEINEIIPKKEDNIIFDNTNNLKFCDKCGVYTDCIVENKENGTVAYFCTDKCMLLNSFKTTPRLNLPLLNMRPSMKINDVSTLFVRMCSTCSATIQVNDYSNISWQARDFCNEKCLTKYQIRFNSSCVECKCSIVDSNTFGKFCMKFGNNIRTFCSKICLDKYKITLIMCQFCNNDIPINSHQKYLAPVTEHSSTFKQFCSLHCVKNYCQYKLKLPYQSEVTDKFAHCVVCHALKFIEVKFQHKNLLTYHFCSEICFIKFQCFNKTDAIQCFICKILYDKVFFQRYCLYDNGVKNFCNQNCQTTYYIIARHIVECINCKVKKYNFDMIQKTFPNNQTIFACSFQCLKDSYRKMSYNNSQQDLKKIYGNLKHSMTLSISRNGYLSNKKNVATFCYPIQNDVSTLTQQNSTAHKTTQTNMDDVSTAILPFPVPLQIPTFIPIPIPIPVPIFIPTGCNTQQEITTKINKIWKEFPQDPLQADLIMLAKTLDTSQKNIPSGIKKNKPKRMVKKSIHTRRTKPENNFGYNVLKEWIRQKNVQLENDSLKLRMENKSNLFKMNILLMTKNELQQCLCAFVKQIPSTYSSDVIYSIFLDIQKYLLINNKQEYIFLDAFFKNFIENFNEISIKCVHNNKIPNKLSEHVLWETNQLGTHTPYSVLNSLIYYNTKLFGLTTVDAHLNLLTKQIFLSKKPILNLPDTKLKYYYRLKYFPTINETGKRASAEIDKQFVNLEQCPGLLYEFYMKKRPSDNGNKYFYSKPELACETESPIWFSNQTLDKWTIEMMLNRIKMVKEICEDEK